MVQTRAQSAVLRVSKVRQKLIDGPVSLSDNVLRNTESTSVPSRRDLTSNDSVESDRLRNEYSRSLLKFGKPLAGSLCPDIDLVALFALESCGIFSGNLDWLEIVVELNLLVEDLLLWVVPVEDLRL